MKKIVIITLASLLFVRCNIYKHYQRPDVPFVDSLYSDQQTNVDTISLASVRWGDLFTDPLLQELIKEGLRRNTDLQIAYLRVTQAEATLQSARLAYLPAVSFAPQGSVQTGSSTPNYQLAVSASWEIDVFGKLTNAKLGAKAALEQTEAYRQAVQTKLISTIANSYYNLLMLDRQLAISRLTADNWGENVKTMRSLKQAGRTTEVAIAQAQANRIAVEASLLTIEKQIVDLENSLSALLGTPPQSIRRGSLDDAHFPAQLSVGVPLQLLANRPDIRQSEQMLAQAFYATNVARAAFYPSITLTGSGGWSNGAGGVILNPQAWMANAVGSLVQPLFNRGLNKAKLTIAKAQQQEALLSFQQALLDAGGEVNRALIQWQTARSRLLLDQQQIESLQSAVKNSQLLMKYTDSNYLEVLTAQQTLLQAQLAQITDRFNEIQGVINLYHSLGGGVQ